MLTPGLYNIVTINMGTHTSHGGVQVLEVEGTLIKTRSSSGRVVIYNTAASTFVSAEPVERPRATAA